MFQSLSKTYCDRPYTELHIEEDGSVTPCCVMPSNRFPMGSSLQEYANGQALSDLKQALSSGIKHQNCEWCWKNEENGLKTHRIKNHRGDGLNSIHIRLNNVCNFKCRMCNPSFSTTWMAENKKHGYYKYMLDENVVKDNLVNEDYLLPLLEKNIRKGTLKHISISGGEPLISDAHYTLLNFLIENKLTNVTLGYSTNLSNLDYKGIDLLSLWDKFDHVNLEASVDGWGEGVEYSRTGFKRKTFLENFKRAYRHIQAINCVVNIYSVWTLPFIERFRKQGFQIIYSPCYRPQQCNPQILFQEDKNDLLNIYSSYPKLLELYENFIDKNIEIDYNQFKDENEIIQEMISYNRLLDRHRSTSFFDIFPQYRKYENLNG